MDAPKTDVDQFKTESRDARNRRDLFRIMTFSTALGMGTLGAFLASIKDVAHDASLEFSAGTVIAFAVGTAAGWTFWPIVRRLAEKPALKDNDSHHGHEHGKQI